MERFRVRRSVGVRRPGTDGGRPGYVADFSAAVEVPGPCELESVDVPVTLPRGRAAAGPVTVRMTVESDTGARKVESAPVSSELPGWVSLQMDFDRGFEVGSGLTVRVEGADGGEPCPVCVLMDRDPGGSHHMRLVARASVEEAFAIESPPKVVVAMPVYGVEPRFLEGAIESVKAQTYPHWELRAFLDGSEGQGALWDVLQAHSGEITVVGRAAGRVGISRATMRCVDGVDGDDTVAAFLDCDDALHPDALMHVAKAFSDRAMARLVYTDEDKIDEDGRHGEPHFKPDFNREMLLSQNYPCHLTAARLWVVRNHPLDPSVDGAQDHDFWLRATRGASERNVVHVPEVLYHWRRTPSSTANSHGAKGDAWDAGVAAVCKAVRAEHGPGAAVMKGRFPGTYRVRRAPPDPPSVRIVIPTKDNTRHLEACLRSIRAVDYPNEIVVHVVDNGSGPEARQAMREAQGWMEGPGVRMVVGVDGRPFNWSALNNAAVGSMMDDPHTTLQGAVVFMNDDVEARDPYWLREMAQELVQPGVAAVGPKLLYPDGRIQHAGVVIGMGGIAGHAHKRLDDAGPAYFCRPHLTQRVSAVTGACMAVRLEEFLEAGMFDEGLPTAFNDIDFCLRLNRAGKKVVYTPWASLVHHESASRGPDTNTPEFAEAVRRMELTWGCSTFGDPHFNKNLDLRSERFAPGLSWIP